MDRASVWTGNDARVLRIGLDRLVAVDEPNGVLEDVLRDGIPLAGEHTVPRAALRSLRFGARIRPDPLIPDMHSAETI